MIRRAWACGGVCVLLMVGCAGCAGGPDGPASRWPQESSSDLVPSGLALAGGVFEGDVVADGAGMVWVDGPWQVARVDPGTGQATIWDGADDLAFTTVERLAPAQPAGVWLDSGDRVRLFDGERFLVDVAVPAQYADGSEGHPAGEVLQVGDELWVSGAAGVGRWVSGAWSSVGMAQLAEAGPLALDSAGAVWAGGVSVVDGRRRDVVVRFDGTSWSIPGDAEQAPSGVIGDLAADPSGGVWVASSQDDPTTEQHGIYRFDGSTWRKAGPGGYAHDLAVTTGGQLWATVASGNGIDPGESVSAARLTADGTWESFGSAEGAPEGELFWPSLAVAGDTVVVSAIDRLVRSEGDRFVTLWRDPSAVVQPGSDGLLAVSPDEAWLPAVSPVPGPPWPVGATTLCRYRAGAWTEVAPVGGGDVGDVPVLATDGAVWYVTGEGLIRVVGDIPSMVAADVVGYVPASLAAGEDGSVWMISGGVVVGVAPDGSRTSIGRPRGSRPLFAGAPLTAGSGVVWTAQSDAEHGIAWLARWDGQWTRVGVPEPYTWVTGLLVAADGAVWATLEGGDGGLQALARYADGAWTIDRDWARGLARTPEGEVCTIRDAGIVCYDAPGLAAGQPVSTFPVEATALSIAADGTAWVLGEQAARLPEAATGTAR